MAVTALRPSPKFAAVDSLGNPLSGGKLYTYSAGTSTALATYATSAGTTANANPVILDSRGEADVWFQALNYKLILKDSDDVTIWTVDNFSGSPYPITDEWITYVHTWTYVSATQVTVPGDQTAIYTTNKAVRAVCTGGTYYGTITNSTYDGSTKTTLTVSFDAGSFDSGISGSSTLSIGVQSNQSPALTFAQTAINAPGTSATSTTSLTIGTGSQTLTVQTGKSFVVGMSAKIAYTNTPTNWMHGDITSYDSSTGVLIVNVSLTLGSGTQTAWTVSLSSPSLAGQVIGASQGGTGQSSYTIGDILYASGATTLSKLAAGTAGYALTSGGAGVAPSWAANVAPGAITTSGLTQATGKLLGRTTAGTGGIEEIAVSGATLSAGTLTISPPTAATGASMTLLSAVTASNSATVDIETTFDSTYDAYLIVISGFIPAADGSYLLVRSKLSGAYVTTGTYNWRHEYTSTGAAANSVESQVGAAETSIRMLYDTGNAAGESASCVMYVYNPSSTSLVKHFSWFGSGIRSNGAVQNQIGAGCNTGTGALTGIRFFASTGNITSGTFRLYGISNS